MSFFALFGGCCGRRRKRSNTVSTISDANETSSLLSPPDHRPGSILSGDDRAAQMLYGSAQTQPGLSQEDRLRVENIGRSVGGRMLAINSFQPLQTSSNPRNGSHRTSSTSSSKSHHEDDTVTTSATAPPEEDADGEHESRTDVRTVSLGLGGMFEGQQRSVSARGRGRGRGRGKGR